MLSYSDVQKFMDDHDVFLSKSIALLRRNYLAEVEPFAADILAFLAHRNIPDPLARYLENNRVLMRMAEDFRESGVYPASSYAAVKRLDCELYNLRLLLSFIITNHRFEILQQLVAFFKRDTGAPRELLSVGVGTGFEVKLARDSLPDAANWNIRAYDCSSESVEYSKDLMQFFGLPTSCIRSEMFPLESSEGLDQYHGQFGKIVLCELLEHLERPEDAIRNASRALHPRGQLFLTMAINMPQEDHIFLYSSVDQAREQVRRLGLRIISEFVAPATIFPFRDEKREKILRAGNYICVVER